MALSTPKSNVVLSSIPVLEFSPSHIDDSTDEPTSPPNEPAPDIVTDSDSDPVVAQSTNSHAPSATP